MSKASFQWNHCPPGQRPPDYICIGEIPKANGPVQTRAARGRAHRSCRPAAEAASAAPGPDQPPRRPQHDPPRRSGTVGASLFRSSIAWAPPGSKPLFCQSRSLAKGLQSCQKTVPVGLRSRVLSAGAVSRRARRRGLLNSLCVFVARGMCAFVNPNLVSENGAGGTCREGPWMGLEPVPSGSPLGHSRSQGTASSVFVGPQGGSAFCLLPVGHGLCKKDGDF